MRPFPSKTKRSGRVEGRQSGFQPGRDRAGYSSGTAPDSHRLPLGNSFALAAMHRTSTPEQHWPDRRRKDTLQLYSIFPHYFKVRIASAIVVNINTTLTYCQSATNDPARRLQGQKVDQVVVVWLIPGNLVIPAMDRNGTAVIRFRNFGCPVLFSLALLNDVYPTSTGFAVYNHLTCEKELKVCPFNAHEGGGHYQQEEQSYSF